MLLFSSFFFSAFPSVPPSFLVAVVGWAPGEGTSSTVTLPAMTVLLEVVESLFSVIWRVA